MVFFQFFIFENLTHKLKHHNTSIGIIKFEIHPQLAESFHLVILVTHIETKACIKPQFFKPAGSILAGKLAMTIG